MLQTYGLTHLQITVRDIEKATRFYQGLFGMKELRRNQKFVMLQTPDTQENFTINATPEHSKLAGVMGGFAHFGFRLREPIENEQVMAMVNRLGGKVIEQGGAQDKGRLYTIAHDPDGYEVEIFWES
jgi:catechol 2,3-dioxygenase-like lactoylglutathione lyase family enzyme